MRARINISAVRAISVSRAAFGKLRACLVDQRGSSLVINAVALISLLGVAALAVDMGYGYSLKNKLQSAGDAAALAAADALPDGAQAQALALEYAVKNLDAATHGQALNSSDVESGNWNKSTRVFTTGGTPTNAVKLTLRRTAANGNGTNTFFARALGVGEMDIVTEVIAGRPNDPVCLLALDPTDDDALNVGNGQVTLNDCGVQVNSTDSTALSGNTNGEITADYICVSGSYDTSPTYSPGVEDDCKALEDPLAHMAMPTPGACQYNNEVYSNTTTISPGVYCGGITVNGGGDVTMLPGLYTIRDGGFRVSGNASISGNGVSIYLEGATSFVDISGGGTVDLVASANDPLAGILFARDRSDPPGTVHKFAGGGNMNYAGVIYFPNDDVKFNGNGSGTTLLPATYFIANTFEFDGNGSLTMGNDPTGAGFPIPCQLTGLCIALLD